MATRITTIRYRNATAINLTKQPVAGRVGVSIKPLSITNVDGKF